jgi:ribosomal protein L11 methyltransferase
LSALTRYASHLPRRRHWNQALASSSTTVARLTTDGPTAARLQNALAECCDGETVAVSITGSANEPWTILLHFYDQADETAARNLFASIAAEAIGQERASALTRDLVIETLAPTDWVRKSLEGLTPVLAGRFVVHGAHDRARIGMNRIAVQIEAALAFGTGHHGSTRGCLLALDRIMKPESRKRIAARHAIARRPKAAGMLDIGTGSGVLAIAAAKGLHRPVLAGDIDPRAVATARDNARINRVAKDVKIVRASGLNDGRIRGVRYALIFANILLEPLRELATPIARHVAPKGWVVLSGLLNAQAPAALAGYRARGLALAQRIVLGGWTTLVLVRPSRGRAPRPVPNSTRPASDARLRPCSKPASSRSKTRPSGGRPGPAWPRCAPPSRTTGSLASSSRAPTATRTNTCRPVRNALRG